MPQSVNLSVSGIYTSGSDLNGLPPGSLDEAINVESRFKNTLGPRRGFEYLENSTVDLITFPRMINYSVLGSDRLVALQSDGAWVYYNVGLLPASPWAAIPGDQSTNLLNPNDMLAKCRFIRAGQNLYLTTRGGVKSLSSGSAAESLRAGVPKGLNLSAVTNGDTSGFFTNNTVLTTTGTVTNGSAIITALDSSTGVAVDQYVSGTDIPAGTTVASITDASVVIAQTGDSTAGSTSITNLASNAGIVAGLLVTGTGVPEGAKVASISGAGPYTVVLTAASFQTATGTVFTFTAPVTVTMSANATGSHSNQTITFYSGAQVGYRMVFGRVETDLNGGTITRLGAPSSLAIANNTLGTTTNVTVIGTLPKNSSNELTFVQLYRSPQTASIEVSPLDQYNLVYERELTAGDFTTRTITITDSVADSLVGIPLYTGSDQEGILQANNPPPACYDMGTFRDFALFANATQPTSLKITILAVGAPSGIQTNDTITISGTFLDVAFTETYTAKGTESASAREFKVFTSGTPSQNITDTANSLIRVINYDNSLPVHVILLSSTTDLPGQLLFEADDPNNDTFTITASAHTTAYDPTLSNVESDFNVINNAIYVSKSGELEAVPAANLYRAGDTSSPILRVVPLRDYVIVLKTDGIYKLQGLTPSTLTVSPFDLTTKIIGPDTAVQLNSAVWMLSNQGVVSVSDGGVDAKSIPIDDQLNVLIGTYLDNLTDVSFGVGYEADRKYILAAPDGNNPYAETEYVFNYVTNSWTKWDRNLRYGFIHSTEGKLYISRADVSINNNGISKERRTNTYTDFVDESTDNSITAISGTTLTLSNLDSVEAGDIITQGSTFSLIVSLDALTLQVVVETALGWVVGDCTISAAIPTSITWKQVFADNPAFVRQFSEGLALFKNTRFNNAEITFISDFSAAVEGVDIFGTGNGFWGLFAWGGVPWGGNTIPSNIRFIVPQNKQLGSYVIPTLNIQQGYSDFKFQGLSISYFPVSMEVGK